MAFHPVSDGTQIVAQALHDDIQSPSLLAHADVTTM